MVQFNQFFKHFMDTVIIKSDGKRIKIGLWPPFIFSIQSIQQQDFPECQRMPDIGAGRAWKSQQSAILAQCSQLYDRDTYRCYGTTEEEHISYNEVCELFLKDLRETNSVVGKTAGQPRQNTLDVYSLMALVCGQPRCAGVKYCECHSWRSTLSKLMWGVLVCAYGGEGDWDKGAISEKAFQNWLTFTRILNKTLTCSM